MPAELGKILSRDKTRKSLKKYVRLSKRLDRAAFHKQLATTAAEKRKAKMLVAA